ncbi:uncharacterized protein LOC5501852 [Nematostella vectensis]|uniref:uncharacterized protein LOC5501852 n=1 Tax=Nematostella vectensis TaxID=45351 RepID=UPI00138FB2C7|nr:uncharacterized protein LOC5501852 [Nematostella vectensis]
MAESNAREKRPLKKRGGRPKRPEKIKTIYLRESVRELWRARKTSKGLERLTDSEFAEVLLNQCPSQVDKIDFRLQHPTIQLHQTVLHSWRTIRDSGPFSSDTSLAAYLLSLELKRREQLGLMFEAPKPDTTQSRDDVSVDINDLSDPAVIVTTTKGQDTNLAKQVLKAEGDSGSASEDELVDVDDTVMPRVSSDGKDKLIDVDDTTGASSESEGDSENMFVNIDV